MPSAVEAKPEAKKTGVQRLRAGLWRLYYQYLLVTAASALEPVEVFVFNSVILAFLALVSYYGFALIAYSLGCLIASLHAGFLPEWLDASSMTHTGGHAAPAKMSASAA